MPPRNCTESIRLIVNPRAGGGRAGAQIDKLKHWISQAFEKFEVTLTEGPGHAAILAAEAAREGSNLVAAVGGDGTCHEVVNGLFNGTSPINPDCIFTVIPFGTGSDLVRSLRMPLITQDAVDVAASGLTRLVDVGVAEITIDGKTDIELFINVAGFGANGEVARRSNLSSKRFGGTVTFVGATLRTLASYTPQPVRVTAKTERGVELWQEDLLCAFVANGHYCGSGMWVGAGGSMSDGRLDVSLLRPSSMLQTARDFPRLYDGNLSQSPTVTRMVCTELTAEVVGQGSVSIELDGETRGTLPGRFWVIPETLPVRAVW